MSCNMNGECPFNNLIGSNKYLMNYDRGCNCFFRNWFGVLPLWNLDSVAKSKRCGGMAVLQFFRIAAATNLDGEWHFRTLAFSDLNNVAFSTFQQAIDLDGGVINHCQHTMYNILRFYNLYSYLVLKQCLQFKQPRLQLILAKKKQFPATNWYIKFEYV